MDNSNRNQKIEPSLRAAMQATTEELKKSGDLATGFSEEENLWEVIILYSGTSDALEKAFPDYHITFLLNNYAILRLPEESIDTLAEFPQIIYIERPRRLFFEDLRSIRSSCITAVQEPPLSLTGKGVLVSVIDSGIDYMHPDFQNEDGSTRILALWDQTIAPDPSKNFLPPHGYALGTLFTQEQINAAIDAPTLQEQTSLCPSFDTSGHGTHVTGIAAGNGRVQIANRGVAYEASLLVIKLGAPGPMGFPSTTQLMQAVDFSVRFATEHQLPLSINLSFGNTYGSHSGTSLLETYLNSVSDLGRICIITGSGNEGNNGGHVGGRLLSNTSKSLEFVVGDYEGVDKMAMDFITEISRFRYGKITGMKSVFSCFRRFPRLPSRFPTHREAGALPWEIQNFLFITVSHLPTVSIRNCTLILFLPAHIFLLVYGPFFLPPRISPMEFMISG